MSRQDIRVASVNVNTDLHPREKVDAGVVSEYAQAHKDGATLPPIVVFQDGSRLFLADGRHRLEAAKELGLKTIAAEIRKGNQRDATLYAVGANNEHGVRRSNADKRKAVFIMLADKEWRQWSLNRIAEQCRVSWDLVRDVWNDNRQKLHLPEAEDAAARTVERQGSRYTQNTGKIGKKKPLKLHAFMGRTIGKMLELTTTVKERVEKENNPKLVKRLDGISEELKDILREVEETATAAVCRIEDGIREPISVYERPRKNGVKRNPEFAKKGLCNFSVGVGLVCGHQCTYCSTPSLMRTQKVFKDIGLSAFKRGYAVVDPNSAERIRQNIPRNLTAEDTIQLSTIDDAWSPESRKYGLGRKIMEVLLENTPAQVRVLTKSAEVARDFDLFKKYPGRVIVGLSTGIPPDREDVAAVVEPNASSVKERFAALKKAHDMGIRTFGMLCPCLPSVANSESALSMMFDLVLDRSAEKIWLEPVNSRGKALVNTEEALRKAGLTTEADAVKEIRTGSKWSEYTCDLIEKAIKVASKKKALDKLHILLYPSHLLDEHRKILRKYEKGIIWL